MIPVISAPNIQVPPPVDVSVFTAPSEPALGRVPVHIVPAPVTNPKVADNRPGPQPGRTHTEAPSGAAPATAFFLRGEGEIAFASPYSTPFIAQLFGQFAFADETNLPGGFLDFEQLAQFNMVKYKPSLAFRPREQQVPASAPEGNGDMSYSEIWASIGAALRDSGQVELRDMPVAGSDMATAPKPQENRQPAVASLFVSGMGAYGATQSRNLLEFSPDKRTGMAAAEISLIL